MTYRHECAECGRPVVVHGRAPNTDHDLCGRCWKILRDRQRIPKAFPIEQLVEAEQQ